MFKDISIVHTHYLIYINIFSYNSSYNKKVCLSNQVFFVFVKIIGNKIIYSVLCILTFCEIERKWYVD